LLLHLVPTATGGFATTGAGVGFTLASAIAFALAASAALLIDFRTMLWP
jgi:hypothetical protein